MGVPSLFLSGDAGICRAAEKEYPGIVTVPTKRGLGDATWNLHPEKVVEDIEAAVSNVLSKPLPPARPLADTYNMTVCYKEFQKAMSASWFPGIEKSMILRFRLTLINRLSYQDADILSDNRS